MLNNLNPIPSGSAPDVLFNFLIGLEAPVRSIYLDNATPRRATIGVGFNVTERDVLRAVLEYGFGFDLGLADGTADATDASYWDSLLTIFQNPALSAAAMQTQANEVMSQRHAGDSFTFASGTTGLEKMRSVFDVLAPDYADAAIKRLNSLGASGFDKNTWSWELIALTSLAYNGGPGIIGKNLANAIRDDNRAAAWYEILFGSNKNNVFGLQNRRVQEATAFGLYDTFGGTTSVDLDEAIQTYRFFTKTRIDQAIQKLHSLWHTDAAGNPTVPITTGVGSEFETFKSQFVNSLSPAANVLINEYVVTPGYGQASDFTPLNIQVSSGRGESGLIGEDTLARTGSNRDLLIGGENTADYLNGQGGDDVLYGGGGNDWLMGGQGNDILNGGLGKDVYYFRTGNGGDGNDKIIDPDGGWLYINDGLFELNAAGVFTRQKDGQGNPLNVWTRALPGGSVLTLTHNSPWTLVLEDGSTMQLGETQDDFHSGDFGIHLLEESAAPETTLALQGDLAPLDQDPAQPGIQPGLDALGNVLVGTDAEPNRADTLYDSPGNDHLLGLGGNDRLLAVRGGNDVLDGGDGDDRLDAGGGDDLLLGGAGSDVLLGGAGRDRLHARDEADLDTAWLAGEAGPGTGQRGDLLNGDAGDDQLLGLDGNDALAGGDGNDLLLGGAGDDVLLGDGAFANVQTNWSVTQQHEPDGQGGLVHSFQAVNAGYLAPTQGGDDVVYAGAGADLVFAEQGRDVVDAGAGNDVVFGEDGDDLILGQGGDDILVGDSYGATPHGNDYVSGGDGNDWLYGTGGDDLLEGGDGNDVLFGDGNDTQQDGADRLDGGAGDDVLYGSGADDVLEGGDGGDWLQGDDGNDVLLGGDGNDTLLGGAGADHLAGGLGDDNLAGGEGDDTYVIDGQSNDRVYDPEGGNTLVLENVADAAGLTAVLNPDGTTLEIGLGNGHTLSVEGAFFGTQALLRLGDGEEIDLESWVGDTLTTPVALQLGNGGGSLYGGAGSDTLYGGTGSDMLTGHKGRDTLQGGAGSDTYLYSRGDGQDTRIETAGGTGKVDVLRFAEGIRPEDIKVTRWWTGEGEDSLRLELTNEDGYSSGEYAHIQEYFESVDNKNRVNRIEFAEGTVWTYETIQSMQPAPSEESDPELTGYAGDNVMLVGGTRSYDRERRLAA